MTNFRKPGSSGLGGVNPDIKDGTLILHASSAPGSVGVQRLQRDRPVLKRSLSHATPAKTSSVPQFPIRSNGPGVENLQRLLNSRFPMTPALKVDGQLGGNTQAAVIRFQKSVGLVPDGVVGKETWFALASAPVSEPAKPGASYASGTGTGTAAANFEHVGWQPAPLPNKKTVSEWTLEERFTYVLFETANDLGPALGGQFRAMISGTGLAIVIGTLVVWAAGHFFGVSEVTDAFLFGFGLVFLGKAAIDAARYLKNFLELTCTASSEPELKEAAHDLSEAIAIIGITAFFALLAKVGRVVGKGSKGATGEGGLPENESEAAPVKSEKPPADESSAKPKSEPAPGAPGSPEHKAQRWADYKARTTPDKRWSYDRWSKSYDQNMTRAIDANKAVDAYHEQIGGWGEREVTVDVEGVPRRLDIADEAAMRGVEYKTGDQYLTQDNAWEVTRDEILVQDGWQIDWVFEQEPSGPLRSALENAGINVIVR